MINSYDDFLNLMHYLREIGAITEDEHKSVIEYVKVLHDSYVLMEDDLK